MRILPARSTVARTVVGVTAAAALAAVPGAAPAAAACSTAVSVPNVSITGPYRAVPATLVRTCGGGFAAWYVYNTDGLAGALFFDPARLGTREVLDVYDGQRLGVHTVRPAMAFDPQFNTVAQAETRYSVKLGSRATMTASRSGSRVTVSGVVTRYVPSTNRFAGWAGARVVVQARAGATAPWRTLLATRTGSTGALTKKSWTFPGATHLRLTVTPTSGIWGVTTAARRI